MVVSCNFFYSTQSQTDVHTQSVFIASSISAVLSERRVRALVLLKRGGKHIRKLLDFKTPLIKKVPCCAWLQTIEAKYECARARTHAAHWDGEKSSALVGCVHYFYFCIYLFVSFCMITFPSPRILKTSTKYLLPNQSHCVCPYLALPLLQVLCIRTAFVGWAEVGSCNCIVLARVTCCLPRWKIISNCCVKTASWNTNPERITSRISFFPFIFFFLLIFSILNLKSFPSGSALWTKFSQACGRIRKTISISVTRKSCAISYRPYISYWLMQLPTCTRVLSTRWAMHN